VRNLHLFRKYTQQFTATTTKKPFSKRGDTPLAPLTDQRYLPDGLQSAQSIGLVQRGFTLQGFSLAEKL
jgi:hypothetical protein